MEKALENFLTVKSMLNGSENIIAKNRAFKKPWKFYTEHTPDEAVEILRSEVKRWKF